MPPIGALRRTFILRRMVGEIVEEPYMSCTLCGRPLGYNVDDQPYWPTGPMCGDCYQAREMDNELWWSEMDEERE